jgi:hypothetical protein
VATAVVEAAGLFLGAAISHYHLVSLIGPKTTLSDAQWASAPGTDCRKMMALES